jgi:hypothetical protein
MQDWLQRSQAAYHGMVIVTGTDDAATALQNRKYPGVCAVYVVKVTVKKLCALLTSVETRSRENRGGV